MTPRDVGEEAYPCILVFNWGLQVGYMEAAAKLLHREGYKDRHTDTDIIDSLPN